MDDDTAALAAVDDFGRLDVDAAAAEARFPVVVGFVVVVTIDCVCFKEHGA